jgi:hypothetical protein
MEISNTNNATLKSADIKLNEKPGNGKVTPENGGGGVYVPPVKQSSAESVIISTEAQQALDAENSVSIMKSGGLVVRK